MFEHPREAPAHPFAGLVRIDGRGTHNHQEDGVGVAETEVAVVPQQRLEHREHRGEPLVHRVLAEGPHQHLSHRAVRERARRGSSNEIVLAPFSAGRAKSRCPPVNSNSESRTYDFSDVVARGEAAAIFLETAFWETAWRGAS